MKTLTKPLTKADARRRHLLPKVNGPGGQEGWGLDNLLAYVQGLAFDAALDEVARRAGDGGVGRNRQDRRPALAAGLRAMIAELQECLALVEGEEGG